MGKTNNKWERPTTTERIQPLFWELNKYKSAVKSSITMHVFWCENMINGIETTISPSPIMKKKNQT